MDRDTLEGLVGQLGIDVGGARVLALLPLVHVAWADGEVQAAEKRLIRTQSARLDLTDDARLALENWLRYPPTAEVVARGQDALVALCRPDGFGEEGLLGDVLALCEEVARAAGGTFGLGAASPEETAALRAIAQGLRVTPGRAWEVTRPASPPFAPGPPPPPTDRRVTITFHTHEFQGLRSPAVLLGPRGERCPITREGVVVGRHPTCDVRVAWDGRVSRKHCRLFERDRRPYVRDLDSLTGTWVNGQRVVELRLFGGELLVVGGCSFRFERARIG